MVAPSDGAQTGPSRPAILIVDDEPQVTRSLARSLRDRFTVFTASSADEALAIVAREPIAVILSDQRMPGITGVQLLERVRDIRPDTLGILLSGYTDAAALVDALNLGNVRGFLPKPWDIHQLRRQLEQAVRTYQAAFLDRSVLSSAAGAATAAQSQLAEIRRLVDQLADGAPAAVFSEWERAGESAQHAPSADASPRRSFYDGPPDDRPISQRDPATFGALVATYAEILDQTVEQRFLESRDDPPAQLRELSERLGTLWAGPRDAVEIHTAALKRRTDGAPAARLSVYVEEGRLLLPRLLGNLVVFYRGWLAAVLASPASPPPR